MFRYAIWLTKLIKRIPIMNSVRDWNSKAERYSAN